MKALYGVAALAAIVILLFFIIGGRLFLQARALTRKRPKPSKKPIWPQTELMKVEEDGEIYAVANPNFRGKRTLPADYKEPFRP